MTDAPAWFHNTVVDGVMRLHVLGLPGTPSAETVTLTATVWIEALWNRPTAWEEGLDQGRLLAAFSSLAASVDRWPAPRAVAEHMPPRPAQAALPAPVSGADSKAKREALAGLRELAQKWRTEDGTRPGKR